MVNCAFCIFNAESINLFSVWAKMLCQSFGEEKFGMTSLLDMFPHSEWTRGSFFLVVVASSVLTGETINREINVNEIISFNSLLRSASSVALETTQLLSGRKVNRPYRICLKSALELLFCTLQAARVASVLGTEQWFSVSSLHQK